MNAKRKAPATAQPSRPGWLWTGGSRLLVGLVLLAALLVGGAVYGWQHWGDQITEAHQYRLAADRLHIPPQPPWIRSDVKAEAIRDGGLDQLDLLDPQATVQVARAFGVHAWVEDVKRVSKKPPARVVVELEYRRPVAMVEVVLSGQRGLLPVDDRSVLLPPEDFSPDQARQYLRVVIGQSMPAGPVGTLWGDERVGGAAKIAAALEPHWQALELYRIVATDPDALRRRPSEPTYHLETRAGSAVVWGQAPGREAHGEPSADEKVELLLHYVAQFGPLDQPTQPTEIDLRQHPPRRTARRQAGDR